jgi:hypothetical protein
MCTRNEHCANNLLCRVLTIAGTQTMGAMPCAVRRYKLRFGNEVTQMPSRASLLPKLMQLIRMEYSTFVPRM